MALNIPQLVGTPKPNIYENYRQNTQADELGGALANVAGAVGQGIRQNDTAQILERLRAELQLVDSESQEGNEELAAQLRSNAFNKASNAMQPINPQMAAQYAQEARRVRDEYRTATNPKTAADWNAASQIINQIEALNTQMSSIAQGDKTGFPTNPDFVRMDDERRKLAASYVVASNGRQLRLQQIGPDMTAEDLALKEARTNKAEAEAGLAGIQSDKENVNLNSKVLGEIEGKIKTLSSGVQKRIEQYSNIYRYSRILDSITPEEMNSATGLMKAVKALALTIEPGMAVTGGEGDALLGRNKQSEIAQVMANAIVAAKRELTQFGINEQNAGSVASGADDQSLASTLRNVDPRDVQRIINSARGVIRSVNGAYSDIPQLVQNMGTSLDSYFTTLLNGVSPEKTTGYDGLKKQMINDLNTALRSIGNLPAGSTARGNVEPIEPAQPSRVPQLTTTPKAAQQRASIPKLATTKQKRSLTSKSGKSL